MAQALCRLTLSTKVAQTTLTDLHMAACLVDTLLSCRKTPEANHNTYLHNIITDMRDGMKLISSLSTVAT